jgi:hypothetical protein
LKVHKKNWVLEKKLKSDNNHHFMLSPAMTSSFDGKIYLSGSQVGKTKAVISVDTKGVMDESSI